MSKVETKVIETPVGRIYMPMRFFTIDDIGKVEDGTAKLTMCEGFSRELRPLSEAPPLREGETIGGCEGEES